jgi:hypothetical protein
MPEVKNGTQVQQDDRGRWAPWWVYLVAIAIVNQIRQVTIGRDLADWANVVTAIPLAVVVFALVTMLYRMSLRAQ